MGYDFWIQSCQDLINAVQEYGIVPYFSNSIPGFSLEEHCNASVLFSETGEEDTWAWKGPVIQSTGCAYAKLFEKKSTYVRSDLFCDLANYRRDGYDFDARYDDGQAKYQDKQLFDLINSMAPVLSKELRREGGYAYHGRWQKTEGKRGFDASLLRLQEQCYVITSDFVYTIDKNGNKRGWGVAEYSTPEKFFGSCFTKNVYSRTPEESYERLIRHLLSLFPNVPLTSLKKFLK